MDVNINIGLNLSLKYSYNQIKGMNSLFGLQVNVSIGDTAMAAVAVILIVAY